MDNHLLVEVVNQLSKIAEGMNSKWSALAAIAALLTAFFAFLAIRQTRELEKDRELPIVIPFSSNNLSTNDSEFSFTVKNIGRGIAKDFCVYVGRYKVEVFGGNTNIMAGEEETFRSNYNIDQIKRLLSGSPQKINARFEYRDIHERNLKTINMEYVADNGIYSLNVKRWKFYKDC